MKHLFVCSAILMGLAVLPTEAGQTGRDQLVLSLAPQVRSLGLDPAALKGMSPARLAMVKYHLESGRSSAGNARSRIAWEIAKSNGQRSFLFDLFD